MQLRAVSGKVPASTAFGRGACCRRARALCTRPGRQRTSASTQAVFLEGSAWQESVRDISIFPPPEEQQQEDQPERLHPSLVFDAVPGPSWDQNITGLQNLRIKNFALVADESIAFSPGLNVITGESGSGKSVLVEALGLITGAAASHDCVRAPANCAVIEGTYSLHPATATAVRALLAASGLPARALPEAGQACKLTIKREIVSSQTASASAFGGSWRAADTGPMRSRCYVNGAATSLRILRELGAILVDANAQDSAQTLRDASTQLQLLDRVAGSSELADAVQQLARRAQQLEQSLAELEELADEDERRGMQELCDGVRRLRVELNEELQLRQALKNMESRRASAEQCGSIRMAVVGEPGSGGGGVIQAVRALEVQLSLIIKQEQQMAAAEWESQSTSDDEDDEEEEEEEEDEDGDDEALRAEGDAEDGPSGSGGPRSRRTSSASAALEAMCQARGRLNEAEQLLKAFGRSFQFDPSEQHRLSERLKALEKLMRAHGCRNTAQLLQAAKEGGARLQAFYEAEEHEEEWERELGEVRRQLLQRCLELSARRTAAAGSLARAVESSLWELSMASSRFDVKISRRTSAKELPASQGVFVPEALLADPPAPATGGDGDGDGGAASPAPPPPGSAPPRGRWLHLAAGGRGIDDVEFLLAAGPGEPLRPLSAVASGGESARVMLALKVAPCQLGGASNGGEPVAVSSPSSQPTLGSPILILDELDSSIGARLGSVVGRILRRICSPPVPASSQVICVTHLPQVACYADQHMRVKKATAHDGRVATVFEALLTQQQRVEEVAAMLGLEEEVATEMLNLASNGKR